MGNQDLIDELSMKVEGLGFIVRGLEGLADCPGADMTMDGLREQCVTFCWLAFNALREMRELIKEAAE